MINFGAETKLIANGEKYIGVITKTSDVQLQGKLVIESGACDNIVGISGNFTAVQPLEIQINAKNSIVTAIESGSLNGEINITKLIAKEGSYIFKDTNGGYITDGDFVYASQTGEKPNLAYIFYSNIDGAKYSFGTSNRPTKLEYLDKDTSAFAGINLASSATIGGYIEITGENGASGSSLGNIYGIYSGGDNSTPLTLTIESDTSISLEGHSDQGGYSGKTFGLATDGRDTILNLTPNTTLALKFFKDDGHQSTYTGFYIKDSTLTLSPMNDNQKIIFDTYEHIGEENLNYPKFGDEATVIKLLNGKLKGDLDFYVDGTNASVAYTRFGLTGIASSGTSFLDGKVVFQKDFFKDVVRPGHSLIVTVPIVVLKNDGDFTLKQDSLIFSENFNNESGAYLIKNTGSITLEAGAKAIFGQEYTKLSEIAQDGIYLAKNTGKITSTSMNFKGNAGITVAGGATLDMTLSSGSLEFDGSNGGEEMIAFNALTSTDPNIAQGKINLTVQNLNSSIIFTKAQGGQLENFTSLVNNPIVSPSPDKNTIVDLAGSSQSREANGKLATRSLTIQNANIKNVNFVAYVNPNISTNDVTITNFDGRAYSDSSGGMASNGASDRIIIEKDLGRSGNNTLSIAVASNQSTRNISGYMLVGQVKTDSNITFNNLRNGDSQNITTYSGLRTTTLTLHRSDVGGYSYYYVTSAQDSTTPPSGGGSSGGSSGGGSSGGGSGSGGGDSGSTGGGTDGGSGGNTGGNTGGGGETGGSGGGSTGGNGSGGGEITPPDTGNGGDSNAGGSGGTTPPSSPDLPVIDAPNVGVAPLTRSAFHTNFTLMSSTLNSLNKRLGDIRSLEVNDGVWARVFVGEEVFKDALQTTALYTSIQAGYDHAMDIKGATNFIGFALAWVGSDATSQEDSYQVSPIDFINGHNTTKTNGVELALYDSYLSSFGLYTDSIVKFGYYSSDVSMPVMKDFTLDNFSFSLSQEVGYQARLGEKSEWLITPQAEVAYAYFSGSNATQNLLMAGVDNIMDISQDALNLLRMRFGVDWGYAFDGWSEIVSKADIHLGTSYEYDVISGGDMTYSLPNMGKVKEKGMGSNGRFVLNIGTNVYIKDAVSLYFDFEKSFGDVMYKNYQANLGMRYSFGEKIRTSQEMPKDNSAPLSIPENQTKQEEK